MKAISEARSKVAGYCGFGQEKNGSSDDNLSKYLNQVTGSGVPLADLLPYSYYDSSSGIAFNRNNTIGFWYEISPLVGSNDHIEKNLTLFFNDELPEGIYLQFLIVASHDISDVLSLWEKERVHGGKAVANLTYYRKEFIKNCSKDFASSRDGRLARNYRTFVTCSRLDDGKEKAVEALLKFKSKLENKLRTEKLAPRLMGANDLLFVCRDILQMQIDREDIPEYDILNNISDQICRRMEPAAIHADRIEHERTGMVSKAFYPKELPEEFSLSEMVFLLGSAEKAIPARFVISYAVAANVGAQGTSRLLNQGHRIMHAAEMSYTRNDLNAKERAREWREILAVHKKGERFLTESMSVMITAPSAEIDIAEETLKSLWNAEDWKLAANNNLQLLAQLSMLPMTQAGYWKSLNWFKLIKYALSGEVVAKLPIQGEWKGVPKSGVLMMGRNGQLFNFNPFYRIGGGGNYNGKLIAPPGAGKSFFLEELAVSMNAQNIAVFILDIGASYKNICNRLDGEMIRFNKSSRTSLNPFAALSDSGALYTKALEMFDQGVEINRISEITGLGLEKIEALRIGRSNVAAEEKEKDGIEIIEVESRQGDRKLQFVTRDSIIYAKALLSTMCGVSGDTRGEGIIERAINIGVATYGRELDITKLCEVLDNLKDRKGEPVEGSSRLADSLFPFTNEGIHGRFFKAGNEVKFNRNITVFEFEEIKEDKPLLGVVLQVILMQITMQFLCGDRSKKFMLIVDEAWMILDYAANFLEKFARTVRKYGGSLFVCTQDIGSFTKSPAHAAILESSTWRLIMQQSSAGIEAFAARKEYEKNMELIKSIRKCANNKFSEVLIETNGTRVIGRLAVDPYSAAMYSTEAEDYAFLMAEEKKGTCKHEALLKLAKKYGTLPNLPANLKNEGVTGIIDNEAIANGV